MESGVEEPIQIHQFPNKMIHFEGTFGVVLPFMEEIRRSPVDVGSLFHDLQGFVHPRLWTINTPQKKNWRPPDFSKQ